MDIRFAGMLRLRKDYAQSACSCVVKYGITR